MIGFLLGYTWPFLLLMAVCLIHELYCMFSKKGRPEPVYRGDRYYGPGKGPTGN